MSCKRCANFVLFSFLSDVFPPSLSVICLLVFPNLEERKKTFYLLKANDNRNGILCWIIAVNKAKTEIMPP